MKNTARVLFTCALVFGVGLTARSRAASNDVELGQTTEIINLLKSHYVDRDKLDQKLLNDATVGGLLQVIGAGVQILSPGQAESSVVVDAGAISAVRERLADAELIDSHMGYIRLSDVTEETVVALDAELNKFSDANVEGYVLDVRFADGTNYSAAAEIASRFVGPNRKLFTLRQSTGAPEPFRSSETPQGVASDLGEVPLMVLINGRTRGSAEALAGALHAQQHGILVGGTTAGSAVSWQDIKLDDGRVLRVATAKIELPNDGQIFPGGLAPDIPVKIDPKVEQDVVLHRPKSLTLTASLEPPQQKKGSSFFLLSEAELVKMFRGEAIDDESLTAATNGAARTKMPVSNVFKAGTLELSVTNALGAPSESEGEVQQVRDVVLQRAVDILKGIRVLLSLR